MTEPQKKIKLDFMDAYGELTDEDFMDVYCENAGVRGRFALFLLGLFVAISGFFFPGYTIHRVTQGFKAVSNKNDYIKKMWILTKEWV